MSLVDRREQCSRCQRRHHCLHCSGADAEDELVKDVAHAARLEVVEKLEENAEFKAPFVAGVLKGAADDLRKEFAL